MRLKIAVAAAPLALLVPSLVAQAKLTYEDVRKPIGWEASAPSATFVSGGRHVQYSGGWWSKCVDPAEASHSWLGSDLATNGPLASATLRRATGPGRATTEAKGAAVGAPRRAGRARSRSCRRTAWRRRRRSIVYRPPRSDEGSRRFRGGAVSDRPPTLPPRLKRVSWIWFSNSALASGPPEDPR